MAVFSVSITTPAAAAGAAYLNIRAASTARARIREIGAFCNAATSSSIGLIRTLTQGTPTTSVLGQVQDVADAASVTNIDSAWSSAPTIAATPIYLRKIVLPASIGAGIIWTFPPDTALLGTNTATGGLLLWNFGGSAGSALSAYVVWEE